MRLKHYYIDNNNVSDILTPEEVARFFRKSASWVYKNWKELGGRKLGGSLFFPKKEDLYEHLFSQGKGVAVRLHPEGQVHRGLVQNKKGSNKGRSKKEGGDIKATIGEGRKEYAAEGSDPNRHGLLGSG